MSSTTSYFKRACPGYNDDDRPFKKHCSNAGLEDDPVIKDISSRSPSTIITTDVLDIYVRRRRKATYIDVVKKKKAMAAKIRANWVGMTSSAQKGMRNLTGAICYRLSLLQSLLHQPQFVHWILEYHQPHHCVSDTRERCVACSLRLLTLEYWRVTQDQIGTSKVLQRMENLFVTLGWSSDSVAGHADPDEHVAWIFGQLCAELPSSIFGYLEALTQPLFSTTICCKLCGYESRTNGHEDRALAIPINPTIPNGTLAMYLQQYMVETVEGYKCEECKDNKNKARKQVIGYASEILTVQLKRMDWTGRKIMTHVNIDPVLDLTRYREAGNEDSMKYELTSVVKHRGTLASGHYIAYAKGPDDIWYEYDDRKKSVSSLGFAVGSRDKWTPYLLFFQRKK